MIALAETWYFILSCLAQRIIISNNSQGSLWKEIEILLGYLSLFWDSITLMADNFTALTAHWINRDVEVFPRNFSTDFFRMKNLPKNDIFHLLEKENCERGIVKGSKLPIYLFHRTLTPMIIEFLSKVINKSGQFNCKFFLRNFKQARSSCTRRKVVSFTQELEFNE